MARSEREELMSLGRMYKDTLGMRDFSQWIPRKEMDQWVEWVQENMEGERIHAGEAILAWRRRDEQKADIKLPPVVRKGRPRKVVKK